MTGIARSSSQASSRTSSRSTKASDGPTPQRRAGRARSAVAFGVSVLRAGISRISSGAQARQGAAQLTPAQREMFANIESNRTRTYRAVISNIR
jgi:hypothetical protein